MLKSKANNCHQKSNQVHNLNTFARDLFLPPFENQITYLVGEPASQGINNHS